GVLLRPDDGRVRLLGGLLGLGALAACGHNGCSSQGGCVRVGGGGRGRGVAAPETGDQAAGANVICTKAAGVCTATFARRSARTTRVLLVKESAWLSVIRIVAPCRSHSVAPVRNPPSSAVPAVIATVVTTVRPHRRVGAPGSVTLAMTLNCPFASSSSSMSCQSSGFITTDRKSVV